MAECTSVQEVSSSWSSTNTNRNITAAVDDCFISTAVNSVRVVATERQMIVYSLYIVTILQRYRVPGIVSLIFPSSAISTVQSKGRKHFTSFPFSRLSNYL